jgi:phospholipid transport system transporter-binding protein
MTGGQGAQTSPARGFAPDAAGGRWTLAGPLTVAEAGAVLAASEALPLPATGEIDLAGVGAFDSTAVAVLLALKRRAVAEGAPLAFAGTPERLRALASLYGVEELLAGV